jgi:hypothetical protein
MSSIQEGDLCPICRAWIPLGDHVCPPIWYVRFDDGRGGDMLPVYAESGKDAAEKFCSWHDVLRQGEAWVLVFDAAMKSPRSFYVLALSVPTYSARPDDERTKAARSSSLSNQ